MSDNVIKFTGATVVDLPPNQILEEAVIADLEECLVIGRTKNQELYIACSFADIGRLNIWLDKTKQHVLDLLP